MSDEKTLRNFEELLYELEQQNIPFHRIEHKPCISLSTDLSGQEGILHIRWESDERFIQMNHVLPLEVSKQHREKMIVLLNRINSVIPMMGFTINGENGMVMYRLAVFLNKGRSVPLFMLYSHLDLSVGMAKEFFPQLQAAMNELTKPRLNGLFENPSKE